jgi:hypothetical protein
MKMPMNNALLLISLIFTMLLNFRNDLDENVLKSIFIKYIRIMSMLISQDIDYMPSIIASIEAIVSHIIIISKSNGFIEKIRQDGLFRKNIFEIFINIFF